MILKTTHGCFSETAIFHILFEIPDFPPKFSDADKYWDTHKDKKKDKNEDSL